MISKDDFKAVANLDLDLIKVKLMHKPSGEGWSPEQANAVEREYRRFLYLMKKFPNEEIAPSVDVDTFWHYHILDTAKYGPDCQQALGYFLHHHPYLGMFGEDAEQTRNAGANRTQELYEQTFGERYDQAARTVAMARIQGGAAANDVGYCAAGAERSAYCATVDKQAAYCAAGTQAAYCAAGDKQSAYCAAGTKSATYCAAGTRSATYCAAGTKSATYCAAGSKSATYCAAGSKSAAYCAAGKADAAVANAPSYCATLKHDTAYCAATAKAANSRGYLPTVRRYAESPVLAAA